MINFTEELLGKVTIKQGINEFEIEIRRGNCLAVFIYDSGDSYTLYNFYADKTHLNNIKKNCGKIWSDEVISCRLNLRYKESKTLLDYFVKDGIKVECYYE